MVLNRNPDNFFAENEMLAFCPALVVPGVKRLAPAPTLLLRGAKPSPLRPAAASCCCSRLLPLLLPLQRGW